MKTSLTVNDVTVVYSNGHTSLDKMSFTLDHPMICGLVGVNGSGKSTLFKVIMGFVNPTKGQVKISDLDIKEALKKNLVSYVPQSEEVDWNFPVLVEDVVLMGRYGHMGFLRIPSEEDKKKVTEALEKVGMESYRKRQIGELSGGQKKRVFIARALAQEAKIILLDEPFTGVDIKTEEAIIDLLIKLKDLGHLIFVSTHDLGNIPNFCDEVVLINKTIIAAGPLSTTFTEKNLSKTFGGMLRHIQIGAGELHDDEDKRIVTVIADDERPLVFYGEPEDKNIIKNKKD